MAKKILIGCAALCGSVASSVACTGISLTAKDGSYVQARTIEGAALKLISEYVIIPRGHEMQSYTPNALNGLKFTAKYGVVGKTPCFGKGFFQIFLIFLHLFS